MIRFYSQESLKGQAYFAACCLFFEQSAGCEQSLVSDSFRPSYNQFPAELHTTLPAADYLIIRRWQNKKITGTVPDTVNIFE